jgi:DNA-binding NarL/FixJ family response regulator
MRTSALLPDAAPADLVALSVDLASEELVVFSYPATRPELPDVLSATERAVVYGVLEGKTNQEIALERGTSVRTVANQIASAFRKLGVRSRGELAARSA